MTAHRKYAQRTQVPVAKSKTEIEKILGRYGADQFIYGVRDGEALIMFRANARHVKFVLPLFDITEAEERRRWRSLALVIKAKLEAVETEIVEFEDEFLAHIVMPDGRTVGDLTRPVIELAYETGKMPDLLPDFSKETST